MKYISKHVHDMKEVRWGNHISSITNTIRSYVLTPYFWKRKFIVVIAWPSMPLCFYLSYRLVQIRGRGRLGSGAWSRVFMIPLFLAPVKKFGEYWFVENKHRGLSWVGDVCRIFKCRAYFAFKHLRKRSSCPTSRSWTNLRAGTPL